MAQVDLGNTASIMASEAGQEAQRRGIPVIGESGIFTPADVAAVQQAGCAGILVGESLIREDDITAAVGRLLA